jgi:NAD(P)-dependent dehydrogenase (short-subunit alcohol dehydrogenase family)
MPTILVTGCNRGIGYQLCKQLQQRGDEVIGICRTESDDIRELGIRLVSGIDVGNDASIPLLREALGDQKIDVLVNNAGILRSDKLGELDYEAMTEQFQVNTLGPLRVTEALLENLGEGSKVAIVTSRVGSIADNTSGGYYGYRASKTAVNQIGKNLTLDLQSRGISVALLHPGLVATEMTGGQGVTPADSAAGLIARIDELNAENSGGFWHAEGYELPW